MHMCNHVLVHTHEHTYTHAGAPAAENVYLIKAFS